MTENFKKCCEKATAFIESCWDENNDDGLTFDERISLRLNNLDDDTKEIVINTMNWFNE